MTVGHPQDQRSLTDQLDDLYRLAIEKGMYDAADWMRLKAIPVVELDTDHR
jgi:hypothetical protein